MFKGVKAGNMAPYAWQLPEDWANYKVYSAIPEDPDSSILIYISTASSGSGR